MKSITLNLDKSVPYHLTTYSLMRKFLIKLNAIMAINGEISIPILNEERRFLIGANIGSVILYSSRIY
mgnify:CR=1 FL=1